MPINFGILAPLTQNAPSISGGGAAGVSAPRPYDPLDDLGSGFLKGLQAGQQYQKGQQDLELGEQQKTQNQQQIDMNELKLNNAQNKAMDEEEKRAGAQKDINTYRSVLYKQNPAMGADFDSKMANALDAQAKARSSDAKAFEEEEGLRGQFYRKVAMGINPQTGQPDPQQQAAIWQIARKDLPSSVKDTIPEQFDQNSFMAGILSNQVALADARAKAMAGAKPSDTQKRIQELSDAKVQAGQGPLTPEQKVQALQQGLDKSITPAKMVNNPLDIALGSKDAEAAKVARDNRDSMDTFHTTVQSAKKELSSVPEYSVGPAANFLKIPKWNAQAQILKSSLNSLALQAKDIYKLGGGQGFTDADRDFLTEVVGNTAMDKYPLSKILDKMDDLAAKSKYQSWKREDEIMQNSDKYSQWKKNNPEPAKSWEDKSKNSAFEEGQIYQDAKGNKAKYVNGKWVEVQ